LYAAVVAGLTYGVRAISNKGTNLRIAAITAFAACMIAPVLMGFQEWDDHDRSQKTLAPDIAKDYLESCAPNAILFTFGDNDTYPLWYAQEVEGVRPDIRIINTSLLGIDWYVNQLRYKVNQSEPIDVIWTQQQLQGLSYIQFRPQGAQDRYYPLYDVMKKFVGAQSPISTFPVRKFSIPVDAAVAKQFNVASPGDTLLTEMRIDLPERSYLTLDQLTILNIIAANNWKRPIYFTAPTQELGFSQYFRKDGLAYRLVPVKLASPQQNWIIGQSMRSIDAPTNNDVAYKNLMTKFQFGGAAQRGTYFDEENRRQLLSIRSIYGEAAGNLADQGRKQEANALLDKVEKGINPANMPYAMVGRSNSHNQTALIYLEAAYKAGNTALAEKVGTALRKDLSDQKKYYDYLKAEKEEFYNSLSREDQINNILIQIQDAIEKQYRAAAQAPIIERPATPADSTRR
jgi:hypothetical protein